jgi:hypothetical protein
LKNGNDGPYLDEGPHMDLGDGAPQPVDSTDADIIWLYDIDRELGVHQHDAAHCSILLHGQYLYPESVKSASLYWGVRLVRSYRWAA